MSGKTHPCKRTRAHRLQGLCYPYLSDPDVTYPIPNRSHLNPAFRPYTPLPHTGTIKGDSIPTLECDSGSKGNLSEICSSGRVAPALESGTGGSESSLVSANIYYALDPSEVVNRSNIESLGETFPPTQVQSNMGLGGIPIVEDRYGQSFLKLPGSDPEQNLDGNRLQQPPVNFLENDVSQMSHTPDTLQSTSNLEFEALLLGDIQSSPAPQTLNFSGPPHTTLSLLPSAILSLPPQSNPSQSPRTSGLQPTADRFPCPISNCTKSFKRPYDVKRHQLSHFARNFGCPFEVCKRSGQNGFFRKDHLEQHLKLSHGKMKLK